VVAHFYYILSISAVFGMIAKFYYRFEKLFKLQYSEILEKFIFGFFLGVAGMPKKIPD
jgi:heme/copper-type cytochrome/quinol oxidase subunit 1